MLSFLGDSDLRLVFFGGKGGVGKTTCAAATALHYAHRSPQSNFLLISTDPAHSLIDSLSDYQYHANLKILEFNAQNSLESFKAKHRLKFAEIASRGTFLDEEDIQRLLDLSLPGLDELMALMEIALWLKNETYERIVVDTAPTGHTLRLLTTPKLIQKWLQTLDALLAKDHYIRQHFCGSRQPDELDQFLLDLTTLEEDIAGLLKDPHTCIFVPVMGAEEVIVSETITLLEELKRMQIPVREVVVNRLYQETSCPLCAEGYQRQQQVLADLSGRISLAEYNWMGLPLCPEETRGAVLETLWNKKTAVDFTPAGHRSHSPELSPWVEAPLPCPSSSIAFLIFAGKGGVGKTTLSCATALHLTRAFPDKKILLFSTDPAHSLSACLETFIGPRPVRLSQGLSAMEIDAPGEFAAWKGLYREDLKNFLAVSLEHLDIPFDRIVMERILDLSPPGLDEIMALIKAMEFLEEGGYDFFILDSAPTGHLFRLLELPELIDKWLKTFFGLFLKYRLTFRFPDLSQRLVKISRELKLLRKLWKDATKTAVYVVTILTEMGFQETIDLLAVCTRLTVPTPVLLLNQVTPAWNCPLCNAINRREMLIKDKFQQVLANRHQAVIYRQSTPRGLKKLSELGQTLYMPRMMESHHAAVVNLPALSN
jgi:arsenite/tail-anchored protein-transporting ATPase